MRHCYEKKHSNGAPPGGAPLVIFPIHTPPRHSFPPPSRHTTSIRPSPSTAPPPLPRPTAPQPPTRPVVSLSPSSPLSAASPYVRRLPTHDADAAPPHHARGALPRALLTNHDAGHLLLTNHDVGHLLRSLRERLLHLAAALVHLAARVCLQPLPSPINERSIPFPRPRVRRWRHPPAAAAAGTEPPIPSSPSPPILSDATL